MAGKISVGSVAVSVVPSTEGFKEEDLDAKLREATGGHHEVDVHVNLTGAGKAEAACLRLRLRRKRSAGRSVAAGVAVVGSRADSRPQA